MKPNQTKVIEDLKEIFSQINAIGHDCTDIFAVLDQKINNLNRIRSEKEANEMEENAKAVEGMSSYVEQVVRPVINKYLTNAVIVVRPNGSLCIHKNDRGFYINVKHSINRDNKEFEEIKFSHWEFGTFNVKKVYSAENLTDYNEDLIKYVMQFK